MPGGKTVAYGYDAVNRLTSVTDWRGGVTTMNYDAVGRTNVTTYTNGIIAGYSYDAANHPLGLVYSGQGATLGSFGYSYDPDGNRQTASDSSGTTTYSYDALDRLTSAQAPGGTTGYGYDATGNRTTLTTAQGATAYSYNEADELTAVGSNMAATYDVDGNRTNSTTGATVTSYTYDDANYLTTVATGASSATYQYNGDHARAGSTVNGHDDELSARPCRPVAYCVAAGHVGRHDDVPLRRRIAGPGDRRGDANAAARRARLDAPRHGRQRRRGRPLNLRRLRHADGQRGGQYVWLHRPAGRRRERARLPARPLL